MIILTVSAAALAGVSILSIGGVAWNACGGEGTGADAFLLFGLPIISGLLVATAAIRSGVGGAVQGAFFLAVTAGTSFGLIFAMEGIAGRVCPGYASF